MVYGGGLLGGEYKQSWGGVVAEQDGNYQNLNNGSFSR